MIPGYCYAWLPAKNEIVTLAETSVGTGMTCVAIEGEMKLVEELIHRIDVIYSSAPYHILSRWFSSQALPNDSFGRSTRHYYEIIEASYRTHLRLPTIFSNNLNRMDENFLRRLAKTDDAYQKLVEYNKTRHLETSRKLERVYKRISEAYTGPTIAKTFQLGDSSISYDDMLQHTLLSTIVNGVLSTDKPREALNYLVALHKTPKYVSLEQLNQLLKRELQGAGCKSIEGNELHSRIFGGYYLITQSVSGKEVKVIVETMQELLGWLSGSAFYNVFMIYKNKNLTKFKNRYEILFGEKFRSQKCFLVKAIHRLVKSLPKDQDL